MTDAYSWKWIFLTFIVAAFNIFNGVCPAETLHISTSSFDSSAQVTALTHVTLYDRAALQKMMALPDHKADSHPPLLN